MIHSFCKGRRFGCVFACGLENTSQYHEHKYKEKEVEEEQGCFMLGDHEAKHKLWMANTNTI